MSEYGSMIVSEWQEDHEVTVLCQSSPSPEERDKVDVIPVFRDRNPLKILKSLKKLREVNPDVVVFNQSIGVWGQNKISNLTGMALPLLTRKLVGIPTFTLLHNVYEEIEVDEIERVNGSHILDLGVWIGTWLLLKGSDRCSVTLERYRKVLNEKYGVSNIRHIPHGIPVRDFSYELPEGGFDLLAFGHWSPNKNLPLLLEAYRNMEESVNLTICGTSHPDHPEYLQEIKKDYDISKVEFQGYIPEEEVHEVFSKADLVILPYKTSVGTSGVLNLAMGYGTPILATEMQSLENTVQEEKAEVIFCEDNPESLAMRVNQLYDNYPRLKNLAKENHNLAHEKSISVVSERIINELDDIS